MNGSRLGGPLLTGINLLRLVEFSANGLRHNIESPKLFNTYNKPVIPASEPVSIEQCLLKIMESPPNGYRIKPGTTISTLFCVC